MQMRNRSPFPNSIKQAIVLEVYRLPGRRARRIAAALNLELKKVNQFLFYEGIPYYGLRQIIMIGILLLFLEYSQALRLDQLWLVQNLFAKLCLSCH